MNQGKLEVLKQEIPRANIDVVGISELKWTGMGEFNPDDHYIYYCGQESLRRSSPRKNEGPESKQKQHPVVDVTGDGSKVLCYKEQYCIET